MAYESAVVGILSAEGCDGQAIERIREALHSRGAHAHLLGVRMGSGAELPDGWVEDVAPGYYDAIVIPPGLEGAKVLAGRESVRNLLRAMLDRNAPVAAIGDGAVVLREAKLFDPGAVDSSEPVSFHAGVVVGREAGVLDVAIVRLLAELRARKHVDLVEESSEESFPASDSRGHGIPL